MPRRHLSRSIAMQTLYEWDFYGRDRSRIPEIIARNTEEFGPGLDDKEFPKKLVESVLDNVEKLDKIIAKSAPEWPIGQINIIDRNILRLGLYELLFANREEVPPKVAINEAIELAKTFGGESSGRFVNGVLGTVYREIGEPGKEHVKTEKDEPHATAGADEKPHGGTTSAYAVAVLVRAPEGIPLVRDPHKPRPHLWKLPGGRSKAGETAETAALREVAEETGLSLEQGALRPAWREDRGDHFFVLFETSLPNLGSMTARGDEDQELELFSLEQVGEMPDFFPPHKEALKKAGMLKN